MFVKKREQRIDLTNSFASTPFRGLTLPTAGCMPLSIQPFGAQAWPMIGAIARGARGQRIRYCRKPDFAVMYADGQCAHYGTNSGKGLQVLRPDLPYSLSLSVSLSLSLSLRPVNGEAERGAMTGIPLLAQTVGPTRWPRGIRKLAKPDLLVSFTCLTRAPATPVPFSRSSSFILLRVGIERRCIARRAMASTGSRLTCIHTYLRTRTYTCFSFGPCSLDCCTSLYVRKYVHVRERQTTIDSVRTGHRCYTRHHKNNNTEEEDTLIRK